VLARIAARRTVAVLAGLLLVLVPTLFSLFPEWQGWSAAVRVAVLLVWVLAAVLVVTATTHQSEQVDKLLEGPQGRRERQRMLAGARLLRALLSAEQTGLPEPYEFRVFLPSEDGERLLPSFESGGLEESEGWEAGQGATGYAWSRDAYVTVSGDAVSDGTYGLTQDQQRRYANLEVVAAAPVHNARNRVIAVLSVSSTNDDGRLTGPEGTDLHLELAEIVARVLIDVLGVSRE